MILSRKYGFNVGDIVRYNMNIGSDFRDKSLSVVSLGLIKERYFSYIGLVLINPINFNMSQILEPECYEVIDNIYRSPSLTNNLKVFRYMSGQSHPNYPYLVFTSEDVENLNLAKDDIYQPSKSELNIKELSLKVNEYLDVEWG
jgi:hypothetical protein